MTFKSAQISHLLCTLLLYCCNLGFANQTSADRLPRIAVAQDGSGFIYKVSKEPFTPWGFNYLGAFERLAEDDWHTKAGWERIEKDFKEMRKLGANVVRWHLQFETFMQGPSEADIEQLARLKKLLKLAHSSGLYLDLTGLNCFRKDRIPGWYDALSESERWKTQSFFWESIAKTCANDSAVFCYDLINEPVINKPKPEDHPWVGGELGGFHLVQRISHKPDNRDNKAIAADWVQMLVSAIRKHDKQTLTTVGVIPWSFVDKADQQVDGWIAHYFGHTIEEHQNGAEPAGAITAGFLRYWAEEKK